MVKKVLVIEDSIDIGEALKVLIGMKGYEVATASSGAEGCKTAKEFNPDLILLDWQLPDRKGVDVVRELRSNTETSRTPILCISSYINGHEAEMVAAGCDEVFSKTSFMQSMESTLKRYLGHDEESETSICS